MTNKQLLKLLLFLFSCALLTSCGRETIVGEGGIKQERRSLTPFSGIVVDGDYLISGRLGQPQQFVISSNPNILPHIKTMVDDEVLTIKNDDSLRLQPSGDQNIWFTSEKLETLTLNGNSQFEMPDVNGNQFVCNIKGSHVVLLKGKVQKLKILINGKANVNAQGLEAADAEIEINGSGVVGVRVSNFLKVKIMGDGKVIYYDSKPKIEQVIDGSGSVVSAFGNLDIKNNPPNKSP